MDKYRDNEIVFGIKWFEKHQSKLLWLLNTPIIKYWFRWVMRIHSFDCRKDVTIIEIMPSSFTMVNKFIEDGTPEYTTDFRTHDKYSKRLYYAFKPFWYLLHIIDWVAFDRYEYLSRLNFGFSTLTQYPGSAGANDPVDGYVSYDTANNSTWATAHDAATGTSEDHVSDIIISTQASESTVNTNKFTIRRSFVLFDTSALTAGATISAAVLSGWSLNGAFTDNDTQAYVNVFSTNPASNTTLAVGDYSLVGTTAFATAIRLENINMADTVYTDFTLNASGIAAVSKVGISKFGWREGHDIENVSIAANLGNYVWWYTSERTGTANDPKLVVTYTSLVAPQINISDVWKPVSGIQINIGDVWKTVTKAQINIGDVWKTIF